MSDPYVRAEVVAWLRSAPNAVLSLPNTPADVLTPSAQRCVHLPQFVWDAIADAVERGAQEPRSGGEGRRRQAPTCWTGLRSARMLLTPRCSWWGTSRPSLSSGPPAGSRCFRRPSPPCGATSRASS